MRTRIEILAPSKSTGFMKTKRSENTTLASQKQSKAHSPHWYLQRREGWLTNPEIHSRLAELLSAKKHESYATTNSWVRAKVSFAILRSALLCLRGSRTPRRRHLDIKDRDLEIEKGQLGLPWSQQLQILYYGDVHRNFHFLVYRQLFNICSVENHQTTKKSF